MLVVSTTDCPGCDLSGCTVVFTLAHLTGKLRSLSFTSSPGPAARPEAARMRWCLSFSFVLIIAMVSVVGQLQGGRGGGLKSSLSNFLPFLFEVFLAVYMTGEGGRWRRLSG